MPVSSSTWYTTCVQYCAWRTAALPAFDGSMRHQAVDTLGHLLTVPMTTANTTLGGGGALCLDGAKRLNAAMIHATRAQKYADRQQRASITASVTTLPTYDWWQLLQISPEELEQQLSTQNVRAEMIRNYH